MEALISTNPIQIWPVVMGWIIVCCLYLFSWKRQALIASMGMTIVTIFVIGALRG